VPAGLAVAVDPQLRGPHAEQLKLAVVGVAAAVVADPGDANPGPAGGAEELALDPTSWPRYG
jgi:hypothetical protein